MFMLFAGDHYYPRGGWNDYHGEFPTLEDARRVAANLLVDWWHIVHDGAIVDSGRHS